MSKTPYIIAGVAGALLAVSWQDSHPASPESAPAVSQPASAPEAVRVTDGCAEQFEASAANIIAMPDGRRILTNVGAMCVWSYGEDGKGDGTIAPDQQATLTCVDQNWANAIGAQVGSKSVVLVFTREAFNTDWSEFPGPNC